MNAAFLTLGCKVNQYETDVLTHLFEADGFTIVPYGESADVFVINSCTVTGAGDQKTRQAIHKCKRSNPQALIALTGCFSQAFPQKAQELSEVQVITGTGNRSGLLAAVKRALTTGERVIDVQAHPKGEPFEPMMADSFYHKTRAFIKIEDGCDRYCSYCIIPMARGHVRSKALVDLEREACALAQKGYRELVLVGINLSSFGKDSGARLIDAVECCCAVQGIDRVRLGSLEPELLTADDIRRMSEQPKFCPQFHLSLQSGSDQTLRRMNRHYDTAEYARIVALIRSHFDNASITTDVMVGFAGESEQEFSESLSFVKQIAFAQIHVFEYSVREGTKAASLPDHLSPQVKKARTIQMLQLKKELEDSFLKAQIGKTEQVLFESTVTKEGREGYTKNYSKVCVPGDIQANEICNVKIVAVRDGTCIGTIVSKALSQDCVL